MKSKLNLKQAQVWICLCSQSCNKAVSAFAVMDCAQAATVFSYKGNQYFLTDTPATWTGAQSQAVAQVLST